MQLKYWVVEWVRGSKLLDLSFSMIRTVVSTPHFQKEKKSFRRSPYKMLQAHRALWTAAQASAASLGAALWTEQQTAMSSHWCVHQHHLKAQQDIAHLHRQAYPATGHKIAHIPLPWLSYWCKSFPAKILSSSSHLQGTNIQSLTALERGQIAGKALWKNPCTCTAGFINA